MEPSSPWKKPDEIMRLHRLKKRKRALQERMSQPQNSSAAENNVNNKKDDIDFGRILNGEKRRNPFSKNNSQEKKKVKTEDSLPAEESIDRTLFELLSLPAKPAENPSSDKLPTFSNLLQKYSAEHTVVPIPEKKYNYIPIDWALKTKIRLMSPKPFPWSQHLKASEEASGITGFVRCLDTNSSATLDTSPRARLHQSCLYWQHPQLPWVPLFPRRAGNVAAAPAFATDEHVRKALYNDWSDSFRSLFQLLRARHCPYFYVCANAFTCLFRAAGLCGVTEPVALVAPTTRGFRQALRQEDVEFTMPLRTDKRKLNNSDSKDDEKPKNSSYDSCYDTMDDTKPSQDTTCGKDDTTCRKGDNIEDDEDLDSDNFLSQMGFAEEDIRRINYSQNRATHAAEEAVSSGSASLIVARGADAQALFNFLLNCRAAVDLVPPTLLAPIAFTGASLVPLQVKESKYLVENSSYFSLEVRGPVMPTALHSLLRGLRGLCSAHVSATFAHLPHTLAFSYAAEPIAAEDQKNKESNNISEAFHKENLSDCGINGELLQLLCSSDPSRVRVLDGLTYRSDDDSYVW